MVWSSGCTVGTAAYHKAVRLEDVTVEMQFKMRASIVRATLGQAETLSPPLIHLDSPIQRIAVVH